MTASETVRAFQRSLITEDEAVEQAMAEDIRDVYRRGMMELARHVQFGGTDFERARPF